MRMGATRMVLTIAGLLLSGCGFLEEILNMRPVEVVDYYPSQYAVAPETVVSVWVEFSTEMNRSQAENAFSLAENGTVLDGRFSWLDGGRRLSFAPATPIQRARIYNLLITTEAEDRYGNSLDRELNVTFSTGTEGIAPKVSFFSPEDGAIIDDPLSPVEFAFSEVIDRESFYRAFSITPAIAGAFAWGTDNAKVSFVPVAPYSAGVDYTVRLDAEVTDTSGNLLMSPVVIGFRLPAEEEIEVASVSRTSDGAFLAEEATEFLNSLAVEKDDSFRISFTQIVPVDRRRGIVTLNPTTAAEGLAWEEGGRNAVLVPGEEMEWLSVYELSVGEDRYRFRVTGEGSRPPEVTEVYFAASLSEGSPSLLSLGDNVDFVTSNDAAVDIVVTHSAEAPLLLASAMEAVDVGISQGAPISFAVRDVSLRNTHPEGTGLPKGQTVIRAALSVEADTPGGGIVTLSVGTDLTDARGNSLPEEWGIELNGF